MSRILSLRLIHIVLLLAGPSVCTSHGAILMIARPDVRPVIHRYCHDEHVGRSKYSVSHEKTAGAKARGGSWSVQSGESYSLP
jgi:hypothetical protein